MRTEKIPELDVDLGEINGVKFRASRHVNACLSGDYSYYVDKILAEIPEARRSKEVKRNREHIIDDIIIGESWAHEYYYTIDYQNRLTAKVSITPDRSCNEIFTATLWQDGTQQGDRRKFRLDSNSQLEEYSY